MKQLSWEYIAGFFDGEGSTSFYKASIYNNSYICNVKFSQGVKQNKVLHVIQEFLSHQNIKAQIYSYPNHKFQISTLQIAKHNHVYKILEQMYPFLIVKKQKAQKIMTAIKKRKWRTSYD